MRGVSQRARKMLIIFAIGLIGFVLGAIANVLYAVALPLLIKAFPYLLSSGWIAWGIIGAMVAIACSIIYTCIP